MQYFEVVTPKRTAMVPLEITNHGKPCSYLFGQTDVSAYEVILAESADSFSNAFQISGMLRYDRKGSWIEISRDIISDTDKGVDDIGRLNVDYISHVDTQWEEKHRDIWAPRSGWLSPTDDGLVVPGTSIPFETLEDRKEVVARLEAKGIPKEYIMSFYRPPRHVSGRFVGREYIPIIGGRARIRIDTHWLVNYGGDKIIGSRPAYNSAEEPEPEIVGRVVSEAA